MRVVTRFWPVGHGSLGCPDGYEVSCHMNTLSLNWARTKVQFLHWILPDDDYRPEQLGCVFWPRAHSPLMAARRSDLILARVRALAAIFAILTLAWIPIDFVMLPARTAGVLAILRIVASAAFVSLAVEAETSRSPLLRRIYTNLVLLYAVPTTLYFGSLLLLQQPGLGTIARIALDAYGVLPVVAMAGLGVFPLTIIETSVFSVPIVIGEVIAFRLHLGAFMPGGIADAVWLLFLMAGIALVVGASQLSFAVALVARSLQDPLTACFTRGSIAELINLHFNVSSRVNSPLAVAFFDLDNFKAINDKFGHDAGDQVLAAAARSIRAELRGSECVGRWGGEEFVVVFPGKTVNQVIQTIERIRSVGLGRQPSGEPITASVGIAERIADECPIWPSLVRIADQRMYAAKRAGRNRVVGPERDRPMRPTGTTASLVGSNVVRICDPLN